VFAKSNSRKIVVALEYAGAVLVYIISLDEVSEIYIGRKSETE